MLQKENPKILYIHCRAHVLQLSLVHASSECPPVKLILDTIRDLYFHLDHSPKRLRELLQIEKLIDNATHKLVKPVSSRWLSYDRSVDVVVEHFSSILLFLENSYKEGKMNPETGSLLLIMRDPSNLFFLCLLSKIFGPIARLSKSLQSKHDSLQEALYSVMNTLLSLEDISFAEITAQYTSIRVKCSDAGVEMKELNEVELNALVSQGQRYLESIISSIHERFSDEFNCLADFQLDLLNKNKYADLSALSALLHIWEDQLKTEWPIFIRSPPEPCTSENMINFIHSENNRILFPSICQVLESLLLLPIGTATVERSFSTMNRILCSDRCRLTPFHSEQLIRISIEGPDIPDVRDSSEDARKEFKSFINDAFLIWSKFPRRNVK